MNDQRERGANSGRGKDAVIAAIATVLAAVIGAAGLYISSSHRERDRAEADMERSTQESKTLRADLSSMQSALKKANDALALCGKPITPSTTDNPRVQSEQGFSVALGQCSRSGTVIDCNLTVTNLGPQQRMALLTVPHNSSDTRAIDDRGHELKAQGGTVAGISGDYVRFDAPSNIGLPAVVRFRDVPAEVKQFQLLEVSFNGHRDFKVAFREVTIGTR
jgi:hypothetical protein